MARPDSPHAQEAWLEQVFDSLDIGVITIEHATGRVTRANEAYARMFGFGSVEEALGRTVLEHYADPAERKEIEARLLADESFRTTGVARIEARRLRHDTKEPIDVRMAVHATFGPDGRVVRMDCTLEDIGERKRAQKAFLASEERFRILFETSEVGMVLTDLERRIHRVNTAFCRFVGRSEKDLLGTDARSFLHPGDRPGFETVAVAAGARSSRELRFERPSGQLVWGYVTVSALSDGDGAVHSLFGVVHDVSEGKRHEQALMRLAKLESLGVLAGGIAHDFNNILAVIMGSVTLAAELPDVGPRPRELLAEAEAACERARDLAKQLVTFAKGGAPRKRTGSVGDVVREAVGFSSRGSNVAVELALPDEPALAEFDAGQLHQVVHNLILNAQQAMPDGGTVRVEVSQVTLDGGSAIPLPPGRHVRIRVTDHGVGILATHLDRIFDPYFSTKKTGSGLGLATAHSIVTRHGGHIAVSSTPGWGTTFEVYLPASTLSVAEVHSPAVSRVEPGASARVLVMDDDQAVREIAAHILRTKGHEVDLTSDGDEAIAAYLDAVSANRPYGVVLLDLTIRGGLGGIETLGRLRAVDPKVKAIVMTGYSPDEGNSPLLESGFLAALPKPFTAETLGAVVRDAIGSKA